MGPLGELGALFNPGMRHEIEERQSKANRREEEGNARDGDLRIDLASGVAVINIPGRAGGHDKSEPTAEDMTDADDHSADPRETHGDASKADPGPHSRTSASRPVVKTAAKVAGKSGRKDASPTVSRRSGSAGRTSSVAPSDRPGEDRDAVPTAAKPATAGVPSSKASRAAR